MQDRRTRPEHAKRNGQVFSWDSPPPDGHPGTPIRCRCTPTPIFNNAEAFELTPEEIAEDLAEQGLIEARQKAAIQERLKISTQAKAEQTQANRAKGAKKAAKTRAKNKLAEKAGQTLKGEEKGALTLEQNKIKAETLKLKSEAKPSRLSKLWENPPQEKARLKENVFQKLEKSDNPGDVIEGVLGKQYFDVIDEFALEKFFPETGRRITDIDVQLQKCIIEVTLSTATSKETQAKKLVLPLVNPSKLPVIIASANTSVSGKI